MCNTPKCIKKGVEQKSLILEVTEDVFDDVLHITLVENKKAFVHLKFKHV